MLLGWKILVSAIWCTFRPILGAFWYILCIAMLVYFYYHDGLFLLPCWFILLAFWYIFSHFGLLYHEKSGNLELVVSCNQV
jgi:hypothetical protein